MQRHDQILDLLSKHKTMSIHQLKDALFCSTSSLRRDLITLELTGSIRRIRGGATLVRGTNFDYSSQFREMLNPKGKEYIADIACDFITDGMSIFLDSSTTVSKLCPRLERLHNIKVATNGVHTALSLNNFNHIYTFISGGQVLNNSGTLLGTETIEFFSNMRSDIALISCRGLDHHGLYEADIAQALVKQAMMCNAQKTILLIDHSKINSYFFHRLGSFSQFHAIITDQRPPTEIEHAIEDQGCILLY